LKKENVTQAIIFCSARKTVDIVAKNLHKQGFKAELIHGNLTQNKRHRALDSFNQGKIKILVASAVAARGLDIKDVSHVINYDLSKDAQEYIHRVGRTARAGERGKAITLLSCRDHDAFRSILDRYSIKVNRLEPGSFPRISFDAGVQRGYGRFGNRYGRPNNHYSRQSRRGSSRSRSNYRSKPRRFGRN
jgi:superfamily II DNA/RNA helicase